MAVAEAHVEILGCELACERLRALIEPKRVLAKEMREYEDSEDRENTAYFRRQMAHMEENGDFNVDEYLTIDPGDIRTMVYECMYMETLVFLIEQDELKEMRRFLVFGIHGLTLFNETLDKGDSVLFEYLYGQKLKGRLFFFQTLDSVEVEHNLCCRHSSLKGEVVESFKEFKVKLKEEYDPIWQVEIEEIESDSSEEEEEEEEEEEHRPQDPEERTWSPWQIVDRNRR